jgi:hypothetical protein
VGGEVSPTWSRSLQAADRTEIFAAFLLLLILAPHRGRRGAADRGDHREASGTALCAETAQVKKGAKNRIGDDRLPQRARRFFVARKRDAERPKDENSKG